MSVAAERAALALLFWARRGDRAAVREVLDGLAGWDWVEVVVALVVIGDQLGSLSDAEVEAQMWAYAAL